MLMGFDGLFTRLESDFAEVLDSVAMLDVPTVWRKVDTVREAKSMQVRGMYKNMIAFLIAEQLEGGQEGGENKSGVYKRKVNK